MDNSNHIALQTEAAKILANFENKISAVLHKTIHLTKKSHLNKPEEYFAKLKATLKELNEAEDFPILEQAEALNLLDIKQQILLNLWSAYPKFIAHKNLVALQLYPLIQYAWEERNNYYFQNPAYETATEAEKDLKSLCLMVLFLHESYIQQPHNMDGINSKIIAQVIQLFPNMGTLEITEKGAIHKDHESYVQICIYSMLSLRDDMLHLLESSLIRPFSFRR